MTLVITALAAIAAILVRVNIPQSRRYHVGALALAYSAASIMWVIDGITRVSEGLTFIELHNMPLVADDALLGCTVVVLGLLAWVFFVAIERLRARRAQIHRSNTR